MFRISIACALAECHVLTAQQQQTDSGEVTDRTAYKHQNWRTESDRGSENCEVMAGTAGHHHLPSESIVKLKNCS